MQNITWVNIFLYFVLSVYFIFRNKKSITNSFLVLSFFSLSILFYLDLKVVLSQLDLIETKKYSHFFEVIFVVSSYFYTKTSFRDNSTIYEGRGFWVAITLSIALLFFSLFYSPERIFISSNFSEEKILILSRTGFWFYFVLMAVLVFGLVQLERTLSALHQLQRWGVKLEIVGFGLLMASFVLYFSHSLLYRTINMALIGPRSLATLLAICLIIYSHLRRGGTSNLAIAPGIAHRSFVILMVGCYLILLGAIGEGLLFLNVPDAQSIFFVVLLVASLLLALLFLSESFRRRLKVFFHKNFYQSKYDYREQWENYSKKIVTSRSLKELQIAVLDFLCTTFSCKRGFFFLKDLETHAFQNTASFNSEKVFFFYNKNHPLILELKKKEWIFNLEKETSVLDQAIISQIRNVGGQLIVPLFFDEDLTGFMILGDHINDNEKFTYEDYDLLRMMGRQAIATVQSLRLTEQLSLSRELATIGKVSTFVLHDLKNQASGLSLMLENADEYIDNPQFQTDMIETVSDTVRHMNNLIARLKNLKDNKKPGGDLVDLRTIVSDAIETLGTQVGLSGDDSVMANVVAEEIYKVVLNILLNATEALSADGCVRAHCGFRNGMKFVEISDTGCGMSRDFIENQLFKPFETTKTYGLGIGLYQCQQIVEENGGYIEVESDVGTGSVFTIYLP